MGCLSAAGPPRLILMTQTSSLATVGSQAGFTVKVLGDGGRREVLCSEIHGEAGALSWSTFYPRASPLSRRQRVQGCRSPVGPLEAREKQVLQILHYRHHDCESAPGLVVVPL